MPGKCWEENEHNEDEVQEEISSAQKKRELGEGGNGSQPQA